jgi:hypothetical protein
MPRIYAILVNGLLTAISLHYAFISQYPLVEILSVTSFFGFLNTVLLMWGRKFPSKAMRWLKPLSSFGNACLLLLLLPLSLIILSSSSDKAGVISVDDIIIVSGGIGFLLLTIALNFSLIQK